MELIKIETNEQGRKVVSARELYLGLGLNKAHWKRWSEQNIIQNGFFKENIDWVGFTIMVNGNETQDFAISLEFAKHIAMMARTEKSHDYRNYFIECERKVKVNAVPQTYAQALLEAGRLALEVERQQALIEEKTKTISILTHVNKLYTATEIAKELGFKSAVEFNKKLCEDKIQYKANGTYILYSQYSGFGYDSIKQEVLDNNKVIYHRKWTQIGRDFLLKKYGA